MHNEAIPTPTGPDPTRLVTIAAAAVAPVLILASTLAFAAEGGINDGNVGGALQFFAFALWGVGVVALTDRLRTHAPWLAALLLLAGLVGAASGAAFGVESIWVAETGEPQLLVVGNVAAIVSMGPPGLLTPLTLLGLGVLYVRHDLAPRPAAVALAAAGVLFPAGRATELLAAAVVTDLLLVVALGAIATHLWRQAQPLATASPAVPADPAAVHG